MARIDHCRIAVHVEDAARDVAQQLVESAVLPRLADTAREQAVAGEQVGRLIGPVECERHRTGGVALQMDDVEGQLADVDCVAVGEDPIGSDRQRFGVELVRGRGRPSDLGHFFQRLPVVEVLVARDDQRQFRGVLLDQLEKDRSIVGGVDQQCFAGSGTGDQVGVVVHRADRDFDDRCAWERAPGRGSRLDVAGVVVVDDGHVLTVTALSGACRWVHIEWF
nr:hypothetical protein CPGR_00390 [Mycolicibacterium malmesburyense]